MFKNFLLVATRNFLRQRFYSFINVFGLSTGLASALFIFLWVTDEVRVDAGYADSDRIYRIICNLKMSNDETLTWDVTPGPLGEAIMENIPEAEVTVRTMYNGSQLIQYNEKSVLERGMFGDSTFFKLFDFKILQGTTNSLDRSSIAISKKLAINLFGKTDPIGQIVKVSKKYDLEVKAVFDDIERGTSMRFEYILPMDIYRIQRGDGWNWGNYDHPLYVKLAKGASPEAVIKKVNDIEDERVKALGEDTGGATMIIVPMKDYYLESTYVNGVADGGRIQYVRIFLVVAIFIVLIACINFMNMATARAVQRAKEVGVRKVVGAQRTALVWQFIGESIGTTMLSMVCAIGMVYALLPVFNEIVSKHIILDFTDPWLALSCVGIVLVAGFLAGSYPAFFLSSYKPASVLKGTISAGLRGARLRKSLVIFQFILTVIMVASALVVMRQVEYIRSKNLGYERKALLNFFGTGDIIKRFEAFKIEAEKIPGVQMVSRSDNSLVSVNNQNRSVEWPGKPKDDVTFFRTVVVDYQFLEAMGVKLVEGRLFNPGLADTASFVVTERSVEAMGLERPVGTKIVQWGNEGTIVGVIEDFHSRSIHSAIDPVVFMFRPAWGISRVLVRYEADKTTSVVKDLEMLARQFAPDYPFNYTFLDDDFERLYNNEKVTSSLAIGFTGIAIIISGLGLLALAAYTAERRRKEISIRKTLGASVGAILALMTREFARLSLIAAIIGCPVAWYLMTLFLEGYAYHMELTLDVFIITALLVVIVSIATVLFQVARAAVSNPVDALRNE